MAFSIRPATAEDAQAVAVVHTRSWQVGYQGMMDADFLAAIDVDRRTEIWHQNFTEETLPNGTPSPVNLIAENDDGVVVGFACVGVFRYERDNPALGELWAMYVHPDHWGTGAGYALMQATMDHFASVEVTTGYLWVLEENARARGFYERQGWSADDATDTDTIGDEEILERRYSIEIA